MTDTRSSSSGSWGALTPVMPAVIRLMAGLIVLVIVEAVVLGFPGISQNVGGTAISVASLVALFIGLFVVFMVLKYGTQIASTIHDHYNNYRTWTPLLSFFFQILAIVILYYITVGITAPYFTSAPWAFPLIFLLIALVPTIKVVTNLVHDLDTQTAGKQHPN